MDFKTKVVDLLMKYIDIPEDELYKLIETPPDSKMGDYAFPCFRLAKEFKKAPPVIATELKDKMEKASFLEEIQANGPYLNFFVNRAMFTEEALHEISTKGFDFGGSEIGKDKTVLFDYSSPNIAKKFHIGHLYSTAIGNSLYRIYKILGYDAVGINYLGDWGTQFGKLIVGYKNWGSKEEVEKDGIEALSRFYVRYHDEAEKNPSLNDDARSWFYKMQEKDEEAISLWNWFREICIADFMPLYDRINISFDSFRGESYYNDKMESVVEELTEKGLLVESDGAMIVDLEAHKMPPCLILRSDGGTLYPTRDIAAAFDRMKNYNFYKSIYITDMRQSLHFAQFFKVIELMGYDWAKNMIHVPYGLLALEGGEALSSRKGNVVLLEDLFDDAAKKAESIIEEKNPDLENKEEVAEQVGVGAIMFATLYNNRIKDVAFSLDRALSFEGETGPYVQYTHARCASLLQKADSSGVDYSNPDFSLLSDDLSFNLTKALFQFPAKIMEASEKLEPYIIARHLVGIAQEFNRFYHDNPIMTSEPTIKAARLYLVKCVKHVLSRGLDLLGIAAPEKM